MRSCPECSYTRAWHLSDGRYKCRRCGGRYSWTSVWNSGRVTEATKRRLLEFFVLGVPIYRMRFRVGVSTPAVQRFFRLIRAVLAFEEECRVAFEGAVECDETTFGGHRKGKRGWLGGALLVRSLFSASFSVTAWSGYFLSKDARAVK